MPFGFAVAVIAGFPLSAAQNWTGIRSPSYTAWCGWFRTSLHSPAPRQFRAHDIAHGQQGSLQDLA
jgi:uncharacterized protein involved in response to NO